MVAQGGLKTAVIMAAVPGHEPVEVRNETCASHAQATRWAAWKMRRLEEEGFDVLSLEIGD